MPFWRDKLIQISCIAHSFEWARIETTAGMIMCQDYGVSPTHLSGRGLKPLRTRAFDLIDRIAHSFEWARIETIIYPNKPGILLVSPTHLSGRGLKHVASNLFPMYRVYRPLI